MVALPEQIPYWGEEGAKILERNIEKRWVWGTGGFKDYLLCTLTLKRQEKKFKVRTRRVFKQEIGGELFVGLPAIFI